MLYVASHEKNALSGRKSHPHCAHASLRVDIIKKLIFFKIRESVLAAELRATPSHDGIGGGRKPEGNFLLTFTELT